jgi:hypothetical protein
MGRKPTIRSDISEDAGRPHWLSPEEANANASNEITPAVTKDLGND